MSGDPDGDPDGGPAGGLVGIVVVSHSRALAHAALDLAQQMVHGSGPATAVAAGLDDGGLGTDAMAVAAAIEAVDGPAGVVVLMDLGSAVLSAEMALELAGDPTLGERVTLTPAPLVEGLVAALVTAAGGADRAAVAAEAMAGLSAKQSQLGGMPPTAAAPTAAAATPAAATPAAVATAAAAGTVEDDLEITPRHGLHARPVAALIGALRGLDADVTLVNLTTGAGPAAAGSPTQVALLGAQRGHRLRVSASGPDAAEAVHRLADLARAGFGEPDDAAAHQPASPGAEPDRAARPVGAAPGIAVGPVVVLRRARPARGDDPAASATALPTDPAAQERRLTEALAGARSAIEVTRAQTARDVGAAEAGIFEAHLLMLDDPDLQGAALADVRAGRAADASWKRAVDRVAARFDALDDPYLRARADDVSAVGEQVLDRLRGVAGAAVSGVGVLVADDLTPAQAAALPTDAVHGVLLARGSATSHAAILARARGIPAVVGAGAGVLDLSEGTVVAIDGSTGEVAVSPDAADLAGFASRRHALDERRRSAQADAGRPATTRDSITVRVACNVGAVADARAGAAAGAEGAGLVRTELVFVDCADEPSVDEQQATYLAISAALGGRRITLRTLDVGGDKPLPYLPVPHEENPFLGLRGLRLSLVREQVLRRQLTAVVRVAHQVPVSVMFPMVTTVDELRRARELLDDVAAGEGLGGAQLASLHVGVMVEVPALALKARSLAGLLDFVSIGTNDLTQYALASERGNAAVAHLADPLDPGVLTMIAAVTAGAAGHYDVAVCGEAAADDGAVPVLLGLGVRELSVSPSAVAGVRQRVRELDVGDCAELARAAVTVESAAQVRALVADLRG